MKENMNILADAIHKNAIAKGFYDKKIEVGTLLMLVVSELGEALEADRKGRFAQTNKFNTIIENTLESTEDLNVYDNNFKLAYEKYIKDSHEDEIADAIIRLLDYCADKRIDIDYHIAMKMTYNSMRERLHGKNY